MSAAGSVGTQRRQTASANSVGKQRRLTASANSVGKQRRQTDKSNLNKYQQKCMFNFVLTHKTQPRSKTKKTNWPNQVDRQRVCPRGSSRSRLRPVSARSRGPGYPLADDPAVAMVPNLVASTHRLAVPAAAPKPCRVVSQCSMLNDVN